MAFISSKDLIFLILLFSLLSIDSLAQQTTNNNGSVIAVGSSLTATENSSPWLSPSGDFAFGFRKVNTTSGDQFLLCIWFARISDETTAWFANKDHSPATTPRGSTLNVTSDHGLILTDPRGRETWRSPSILRQVSSAAMTDQGNFVLRDTSSNTLWQSFDSPTDTLLPSQTLSRGGSLRSRQSEANFDRGRFRLLLQQDGNLVLATINLPSEYSNQPYFATATDTDGSSTSSPGKQLVFNETTNLLYVSRENGETVRIGDDLPPASQSQNYWRATLGLDGVLSLYRYARSSSGNGSWNVTWSEPDNICQSLRIDSGLGVCGYNSICRLRENERRPYCECPRGYSLADPGNSFGDCKADFVQGCAEDGYGNATNSLYDVDVLINIDWPTSDYMQYRPFTAELCRESCLQDCLCSVAIFRDNTCWKKKLPLSNGRFDTSLDSRAFLKVRKPENGSVIAVGSSLTATENSSPWLSPSGDFAFGFRKVNTTNDDLFLLSIWFARISDETTVWFANRDHSPATTPRGSTLKVTSDHGLILTDPRGRETWRSESILRQVSSAAMTDQGNFVLRDRSSGTLWQSFDSPTDTLLPSQTLSRGGSLWSRQSETSFGRGRFRLLLQQDGNLVLATINLPTEYQNQPYFATSTSTNGSSSSSPGKQLVFNETTNLLYVSRENGETVRVGDDVPPASQNSLRATLGLDGVLSLYRYARSSSGNGSWSVAWSQPDNICQSFRIDSGLGVCGYNSICRLRENERKPYCECPRGYSLADPGDSFGDCRADFVHGCAEDGNGNVTSSLYDVDVLINIDWPTSDYMQFRPFTAELCRESCLDDCLCSVAIFRDNTCWKKKLPLSNGRFDTGLNSSAFLKLRKPEFSTLLPDNNQTNYNPNNNNKGKDSSALFVTSVAANVLFGVVAICVGFFFLFVRRRGEKKPAYNNRSSFQAETNLYRFTYKELEEATCGFKEELGRGAFGVVYKGTIGGTAVAVKKLSHVAPETEKEFKNEVDAIGRTHHKNLVQLLGYCDDGKNRLLVYEYLSNGTLANYIFLNNNNKPSWKERTETAIGIARGLLYLHEECGGTQVIHCDVKPQNILLDESNNPRISDFGLAKLLMADQSRTSTMIRGTKGYVAPEWFRNAPVTAKVDVYSFGVVLLEIVCCRRSVDCSEEAAGKEILTDWAYDCYREGFWEGLVDWEAEALEDRERLERFVMISIWCVQENPFVRPNMRRVLQMLEGVVQVLVPPCPYVHDNSFI